MKKEEAIEVLKMDPRIRKALMVLLDEAVTDQENKLLGSSTDAPDSIVRARQQLEGARVMRTVVSRLTGAAK